MAYVILQGRVTSGQVRLSNEHDDYVWVAAADMAEIDLCEQFRPFADSYRSSGTNGTSTATDGH